MDPNHLVSVLGEGCYVFAMDVNYLVARLADGCYLLLTLNFLWGLFCVVLLWRRLGQLRFRSEQAQTEFLGELQQRMDASDFDGAAQSCETDSRALPQIARLVLGNRGMPYDQLRQWVAELINRDVLADLEYRLSWVATVIKSGPLLGLFGTVLGMMAAFGRIGTGEKVQPHEIAHEISVALICTAMGLVTAIPFGYLLASLTIRVRMLQESLTSGLTRFLDQFKAVMAKIAGAKSEYGAKPVAYVRK
jgi:biopolymer transport protein ExbB